MILQALILASGISNCGVLTIKDNEGGYVLTVAQEVLSLPDCVEVRLEGLCASACTLYLGHPNACVASSTVLVFHKPRKHFVSELSPAELKDTLDLMLKVYPKPIGKFFKEKVLPSSKVYTFKGSYFINKGIVRKCTHSS